MNRANDNAPAIEPGTVWMQSRAGRVNNMLDPSRNVIDFVEIADTLADINRYNGCGDKRQVSVAFHTIVCCHLAPLELKPYMLLHDAHEAIIGDITTPASQAIAAIALEMHGFLDKSVNHTVGADTIVKDAIRELKRRHDVAIHAAAGLPMPTADQKAAIRAIDMMALNTERRDFLKPEPHSWQSESFGADQRDWSVEWNAPRDTADWLLDLFIEHLPVYREAEAA